MRSMQPHDKRRRQLAQIHLAAKQLGLDDDTYRAMLREVAGVTSAGDLTDTGRRRVLDHLRRLGWHARPKRKRVAQHPGTPHNIDREAQLQKIEAQLADMGLPWSYADAIARRQTGIERVAWVRSREQLAAIIAALAVEQEKRALLARVDELLAQLGRDRGYVAQRVRRAAWERHRPTLRAVCEWLAAQVEHATQQGERPA